jgi:hypothetical protein
MTLPYAFTTDGSVPTALVDYYMPVGTEGFQFVAALMAYIRPWGPVFPVEFTRAAYLRAASTLAHMGIVRGETLTFLRDGAQLTQPQAASLLGVTLGDIVAWESNAAPIPRSIWDFMAHYVCDMDNRRGFTPNLDVSTSDFRARTIRIRPDIPYPDKPITFPCPPDPCA